LIIDCDTEKGLIPNLAVIIAVLFFRITINDQNNFFVIFVIYIKENEGNSNYVKQSLKLLIKLKEFAYHGQ
jgi:hypothetical protein